MFFKNGLLSQIKLSYPNMMAIAWFLGNIFEKELELELNENEAGFLALHIGGAIERQLSSVTACIVCDYGVGISQVFERKKLCAVFPKLKLRRYFRTATYTK
ncbi:MAG: PRD domain-containing protein [Clostridiales bacterium]|nr:MAG: PRD domain-containing protein [Clostridiales bacterium]